MKTSKRPIWRKSMLQSLNLSSIVDYLYEIAENGDEYGYERYEEGESGYYQEYKPLFDELAGGASRLIDAIEDSYAVNAIKDVWDDMTVALLGETQSMLGYDAVEDDYFGMLEGEETLAQKEAKKRISRLTKQELIECFRVVLVTLTSFFDIKAAHDCLTSIVTELDEKGALLERKNNEINRVYKDLTGKNEEQFDQLIANLPQRMWVE
jgi:hypothetical protein